MQIARLSVLSVNRKMRRVIVDHRDGNGHPSNTLSRQWSECQMAATLPRIFPLGTGPNQRLSIASVRRSQIRKYVPPGTISLSPSWVKHWKSGSYRPIRSVGPTGGLHSESGHPLTWMRRHLTSNTSPGTPIVLWHQGKSGGTLSPSVEKTTTSPRFGWLKQ